MSRLTLRGGGPAPCRVAQGTAGGRTGRTFQVDRLIRAIEEKGNPTALGLDTRLEYLPAAFARPYLEAGGAASAVRAFNFALLEALRDLIPCVKVQAAYYELMGASGVACMEETLAEARRLGYVVILDAKRGDIGATAAAYSEAYLAEGAPAPVDFLTVNPYFGTDGVQPFLEDCGRSGRGLFVLVKTSNPSSGEFQDVRGGWPAALPPCGEEHGPLGRGPDGRDGLQRGRRGGGRDVPGAGRDAAAGDAPHLFPASGLRGPGGDGPVPGGLLRQPGSRRGGERFAQSDLRPQEGGHGGLRLRRQG
ncbi:orotidine-5'-phosphate decarboxylase [Fretibacterium fastidiosum]|uniref:orotidine-5'-phosphate decarboxylase n=1 Tax=Fretibacterium fastidiosum TaxID=651822 RepID=UPI0003000A0D|nr:orotidine-5'-phosphate decarboxylase [Fretibacterium fastidiosum]